MSTPIAYTSKPAQLMKALEQMLLDTGGSWGHGLGFGWGGIGVREPVIPKYPAFFLTPQGIERQYDGEWNLGINVWIYLRVVNIDDGHLLLSSMDKAEAVARQIQDVQDRLVEGVYLRVDNNTDYNVAYSPNPEEQGEPRLDVHVITHTIRPMSTEELI